jgi:hypothetical protein
MSRNREKLLFEALASFSVPLERAFHAALEAIKTDESISDKHKAKLLSSTKAILFNSLELHDYVAKKDSNFDFENQGKEKYSEIRNEYKNAFQKAEDDSFNLHAYINKETSLKTEKRLKNNK